MTRYRDDFISKLEPEQVEWLRDLWRTFGPLEFEPGFAEGVIPFVPVRFEDYEYI